MKYLFANIFITFHINCVKSPSHPHPTPPRKLLTCKKDDQILTTFQPTIPRKLFLAKSYYKPLNPHQPTQNNKWGKNKKGNKKQDSLYEV